MFAATRDAALTQLEDFIPFSGKYSRDRNHVYPSQHQNVSRLSPAIRHRILTEEEAATAPLKRYATSTLEKFTQEIYWRRYWKSWLSLRPQVWEDYLTDLATINSETSPCHQDRLEQVLAGHSGLAIMDLFTRELLETGYLHNHARMWWAGWWIHIERLPWQLGADFFYQNLLDADPASNTLSWRWVAGLQTPGKTYLPRRSNLEKYLPPELLAEHANGLELLERPQPFLPETIPRKPIITHSELTTTNPNKAQQSLLLIHEEDLSPETSPLIQHAIEEVWVLADRLTWQTQHYSSLKKEWLETALHDVHSRAQQLFPQARIREKIITLNSDVLVSELQACPLKQVLTLRPEVGHLATSLASLNQSHPLHFIDRPEDLALRPLATAGFFGFWKNLQSKNLLPRKPEHSQPLRQRQ